MTPNSWVRTDLRNHPDNFFGVSASRLLGRPTPLVASAGRFARNHRFVEIAAFLQVFFTAPRAPANPDCGPSPRVFPCTLKPVFPFSTPCGNECSPVTAKIVSKWHGGCYWLWKHHLELRSGDILLFGNMRHRPAWAGKSPRGKNDERTARSLGSARTANR